MSEHRIFFDTEFLEDGKTIDLISIGMVRDDGEAYYAQRAECDLERVKAHPWLSENVVPHLGSLWIPAEQMRQEIRAFAGLNPEFWAYYGDYDWVVLCQLFGTMMDLPPTWPMYCRDLKQLLDEQEIEAPPAPEDEHSALADAHWGMGVLESVGRLPTRKDYEELLESYAKATS